MKIVILYSGGLDSLIMNHYAKIKYPDAEVIKLYWDIGQEYNHKELAVLPKDVIVKKLDWLGSDVTAQGKGTATGNIYIPGRNLILASLAACQYLPDEIWLGALQGEIHANATDKNYEFLSKLNDTLQYVLGPFTKNVKVRFPLADEQLNKLTATSWALDNGLPVREIIGSSSCLNGEGDGPCGHCHVCVRRYGIFRQLGLVGKNENLVHNRESVSLLIKMLEDQINPELAYYDEHRRSEIIPALMMDYPNMQLREIKRILEKLYED